MNNTLKRIATLVSLCIKGPGGKIGILYCFIVLALNLVEIQLAIRMISWNKDFYSALEKYDARAALWQIGIFGLITLVSALQFLVASYIRQLVQIRWRTTLTRASLERWFSHKAYWHMNTDENSPLDNPDQRISEDCRIFVDRLTGKGLDLFTGLVGLTTYLTLLWQLSDFPIAFTLFGTEIVIEHYLVWAAPIYVLVSSGLTHWMGAPLMKLNVVQQHREADMRFALARLRESREAVALENGETAENDIIDKRFKRIIENWRHRINREFILGLFTRPYYMTVLRIPLFLAFPAYLAGFVALGGLMQLGSAFTRLVTTLSWFIFSYKELAELSATANRLSSFMHQAEVIGKQPPPLAVSHSSDNRLCIRNLTLRNPSGQNLLHIPELVVTAGEAIWIDGPSGIGKSTLLKALSGIWPYCNGEVTLPAGKILFMPQKASLPLGSLAECVTYPGKPDDPEYIRQLLKKVGLTCPRHEAQLEQAGEIGSDYRLSGGEQQRLMMARILSAQPEWVFLDEATSSLDACAEEELYHLLRTSLPDAGFIVIAHREPKGLGQYRRIDLWPSSSQPAQHTLMHATV